MERQRSEVEFTALIESNQRLIRRVCRNFARTAQDREDLFQEIVYQLWRGYASFAARAKVTTWMYRIALNTAVTRARHDRRAAPQISLNDLSREPSTPDRSADDERAAVLQHAMQRLSPVDRALVLLYLDDLSYREISDIIGVSENTVGVRLNRIRARLAKAAGIVR